MAGAMALFISASVLAATNISGVVTDSITGQAIVGAPVTLSSGQARLSAGVTESGGVFQLFADIPLSAVPKAYILEVSQSGYGAQPRNVTVTSGQANQLSYKFSLVRNEARECVPSVERTVVIGYVREPASATRDLGLSERVRDVLVYDLLTEVQKTNLPPAQQPTVLACPHAQPRTLNEHSNWARALKADAFVVGAAEPVNRKFKVDMQVTARYEDAANLPALATTPAMNLDQPRSADLGRAAMEPIMIALLKGYFKDERYPECVEFSTAAEHALGRLLALTELRKSCQLKLPNKGLLTGGGQ